MPLKLFTKRVFPCGESKPRKLEQILQHYGTCYHNDCNKKLEAFVPFQPKELAS